MIFGLFKKRFKLVYQYDIMDCGPACLKMISQYYGKHFGFEYLRDICYLSREGVSLLSLNDAAESLKYHTLMLKLTYDKLKQCPTPCILHWFQTHYIVLIDIRPSANIFKRIWYRIRGKELPDVIRIADPAKGIFKLDKESFLKNWVSTSDNKGIALMLEPTPEFFDAEEHKDKKKGFGFLIRHLRPHKRLLGQMLLGMLVLSIINLVFPFLTQALIDKGVGDRSLHIVALILLAQLFLFFGETVIELIRNWILLHVNTRISMRIISGFLSKLLHLPVRYFDTKVAGDILQRIQDHKRIENFLTGVTLDTLFSIITILIFSVVLFFYSPLILGVFLIFSVLGILWVLLYQKRRKTLDYIRFQRNRENQEKLMEIIEGMQEIKLYGSETAKRWEWERLQLNYFKLNTSSLRLEQYQKVGYTFFSQLKNIIISYAAAMETINGNISLGMMLSISYIIGQTNGPLSQMISFIRSLQDAKLSMDRLQEIHNKENEEEIFRKNNQDPSVAIAGANEAGGDITIEDLSFQYEGPNSPFVLKDINMVIPKGKVTAIVGASGSGKTTLMKLLLNFYDPVAGRIKVGQADLKTLLPSWWRRQCGSVMQNGYIFTDTIARNIAADGKEIDVEQFKRSIEISNLEEFVSNLPLAYTTRIGKGGIGLSGGQQQRILIARAVYKDPKYLFFDEATSSLDANNERLIMDNLNEVFSNKTVLVIAHRLSTVRNADQIIVLDKGRIVEVGNHDSLTTAKGFYFTLVKNQLELSN